MNREKNVLVPKPQLAICRQFGSSNPIINRSNDKPIRRLTSNIKLEHLSKSRDNVEDIIAKYQKKPNVSKNDEAAKLPPIHRSVTIDRKVGRNRSTIRKPSDVYQQSNLQSLVKEIKSGDFLQKKQNDMKNVQNILKNFLHQNDVTDFDFSDTEGSDMFLSLAATHSSFNLKSASQKSVRSTKSVEFKIESATSDNELREEEKTVKENGSISIKINSAKSDDETEREEPEKRSMVKEDGEVEEDFGRSLKKMEKLTKTKKSTKMKNLDFLHNIARLELIDNRQMKKLNIQHILPQQQQQQQQQEESENKDQSILLNSHRFDLLENKRTNREMMIKTLNRNQLPMEEIQHLVFPKYQSSLTNYFNYLEELDEWNNKKEEVEVKEENLLTKYELKFVKDFVEQVRNKRIAESGQYTVKQQRYDELMAAVDDIDLSYLDETKPLDQTISSTVIDFGDVDGKLTERVRAVGSGKLSVSSQMKKRENSCLNYFVPRTTYDRTPDFTRKELFHLKDDVAIDEDEERARYILKSRKKLINRRSRSSRIFPKNFILKCSSDCVTRSKNRKILLGKLIVEWNENFRILRRHIQQVISAHVNSLSGGTQVKSLIDHLATGKNVDKEFITSLNFSEKFQVLEENVLKQFENNDSLFLHLYHKLKYRYKSCEHLRRSDDSLKLSSNFVDSLKEIDDQFKQIGHRIERRRELSSNNTDGKYERVNLKKNKLMKRNEKRKLIARRFRMVANAVKGKTKFVIFDANHENKKKKKIRSLQLRTQLFLNDINDPNTNDAIVRNENRRFDAIKYFTTGIINNFVTKKFIKKLKVNSQFRSLSATGFPTRRILNDVDWTIPSKIRFGRKPSIDGGSLMKFEDFYKRFKSDDDECGIETLKDRERWTIDLWYEWHRQHLLNVKNDYESETYLAQKIHQVFPSFNFIPYTEREPEDIPKLNTEEIVEEIPKNNSRESDNRPSRLQQQENVVMEESYEQKFSKIEPKYHQQEDYIPMNSNGNNNNNSSILLKLIKKELRKIEKNLSGKGQKDFCRNPTIIHQFYEKCRRGIFNRKIGNIGLALKDFNDVLDENERMVDSLWQRHLIWLLREDFVAAYDDLERILSINKKCSKAHYSKSLLHEKINEYHLSIEHYSQCLKCVKENWLNENHLAQIHLRRGICYEKVKNIELAMDDYGTAVKYDGTLKEGWMRRANYYSKIKEWNTVIQDLSSLLHYWPLHRLGYMLRGKANLQLKMYQLALNDFCMAIRLDPLSSEVYYYRACLISKNHVKEAINDLSYSIMLCHNSSNIRSYIHRGLLYQRIKNYEAAINDFELALQQDKTSFISYLNLAVIFYKHFQFYAKSLKYFSAALKLQPTYIRTYLCRMVAYVTLHQLPEAIGDLQTVVVLDPKNVDYRILLGDLMQRVNKINLAELFINKSSNLLQCQTCETFTNVFARLKKQSIIFSHMNENERMLDVMLTELTSLESDKKENVNLSTKILHLLARLSFKAYQKFDERKLSSDSMLFHLNIDELRKNLGSGKKKSLRKELFRQQYPNVLEKFLSFTQIKFIQRIINSTDIETENYSNENHEIFLKNVRLYFREKFQEIIHFRENILHFPNLFNIIQESDVNEIPETVRTATIQSTNYYCDMMKLIVTDYDFLVISMFASKCLLGMELRHHLIQLKHLPTISRKTMHLQLTVDMKELNGYLDRSTIYKYFLNAHPNHYNSPTILLNSPKFPSVSKESWKLRSSNKSLDSLNTLEKERIIVEIDFTEALLMKRIETIYELCEENEINEKFPLLSIIKFNRFNSVYNEMHLLSNKELMKCLLLYGKSLTCFIDDEMVRCQLSMQRNFVIRSSELDKLILSNYLLKFSKYFISLQQFTYRSKKNLLTPVETREYQEIKELKLKQQHQCALNWSKLSIIIQLIYQSKQLNMKKIEFLVRQYNKSALDSFTRCLNSSERTFNIYLDLAAFYDTNQQRVSKAILNCNEALKIAPNLARSYLYRGSLKMKMKLYKNAITDIEKAIKMDGKCVHAYFNLAICYQILGEYSKSIELYSVIIMENYSNYFRNKVYLNRGLLYFYVRKYENALADFHQLSASPYDQFLLELTIGKCYQGIGDMKKCIFHFTYLYHVLQYHMKEAREKLEKKTREKQRRIRRKKRLLNAKEKIERYQSENSLTSRNVRATQLLIQITNSLIAITWEDREDEEEKTQLIDDNLPKSSRTNDLMEFSKISFETETSTINQTGSTMTFSIHMSPKEKLERCQHLTIDVITNRLMALADIGNADSLNQATIDCMKLLRIYPGNLIIRINLTILLVMQSRMEKALLIIETAINLYSKIFNLFQLKSSILYVLGHRERALSIIIHSIDLYNEWKYEMKNWNRRNCEWTKIDRHQQNIVYLQQILFDYIDNEFGMKIEKNLVHIPSNLHQISLFLTRSVLENHSTMSLSLINQSMNVVENSGNLVNILMRMMESEYMNSNQFMENHRSNTSFYLSRNTLSVRSLKSGKTKQSKIVDLIKNSQIQLNDDTHLPIATTYNSIATYFTSLLFYNKANLLIRQNRYKESLRHYSGALYLVKSLNRGRNKENLFGENSDIILCNRSISHMLLRQFDSAFDDINQAIELNCNCSNFFTIRATYYYLTKQYDLAKKDVSIALNLNPLDSISKKLNEKLFIIK
ncbi:hypothetical protein SNEBB_010106 [Seison nebaliae]|nr:hypothetical protein SNEBB_010106 [Seison nebaliae]